MAELELSLDDLREQIRQGREYTLAENFYHNSNVLIGKERVLTVKDVDRMDGKVYDNLRVKEYVRSGVDEGVTGEMLALCLRVLKEYRDYKGLLAEKKKRVEQVFSNILPTHEYACLRLQQIKKASSRLFLQAVNVAIKALIVDIAWQARHNQGMQDSRRLEEILVGSLLRPLGFLKTSREVVDAKIGQLRATKNPLYLKVPDLSVEIVQKDGARHEITQNTQRVIHESFEYADGSGFPRGLAGEQIYPLALSVCCCAEFDHLLASELSEEQRSYMEVNRRLMAMASKFDKYTINIIAEEFRYIRDTRG